MAKIQWLTYYIVLTDPERVKQLQGQYPHGVLRAPYAAGPPEGGAAIEFSAPFRGYTEPAASQAPFIWTPWMADQGGNVFPLNVATFQRKTGGWWVFGGSTTRYYWIGQFVYAAPTTPTVGGKAIPTENKKPISQRRWICGFEGASLGLAGSTGGVRICRDASRHVGGMGYAHRADAGAGGIQVATRLFKPPGSVAPTRSWERLYFRSRAFDTTGKTLTFWRTVATPTPANGCGIGILPSGELVAQNLHGGGADILGTLTSPLTLHRWYRLDMVAEFNTAPTGGSARLRVYVDGTLAGDFTVAGGAGGFGSSSQQHNASEVGNVLSVTASNAEFDLDDWMCAEVPELLDTASAPAWSSGTAYTIGNTVFHNGYIWAATSDHTADATNAPGTTSPPAPWAPSGAIDWLSGSKIALVRPTGFSALHAGWTGDYRYLAGRYMPLSTNGVNLSSSTAGALCEVTTDAERVIERDPAALGAVAVMVCAQAARGSTAGDGTFGLDANGTVSDVNTGADYFVANPQTAAVRQHNVLYAPSGLIDPPDLTPLRLRHVKNATGDACTIRMLVAEVELIGVFGAEDIRASEVSGGTRPAMPRNVGHHNAAWPTSQWAIDALAAPIAPYFVRAGTYVGNGVATSLPFKAPIHFLWTRPLSGGSTAGFKWFSCMNSAHEDVDVGVEHYHVQVTEENAAFVPDSNAEEAQQQEWLVHIVGNDGNSNANGVTYQYIAVSDPSGRLMCNHQITHATGAAGQSPISNPLPADDFTPLFGFFQVGDAGNLITDGFGLKAPGHAAAAVSRVVNGTTATAMEFASGRVTTHLAFHQFLSGHSEIALSLWRRADGNNDPNEARVASYGSYNGDGAASRSVSVSNPPGLRPLFAVVLGENGTGRYRDPSHTGTTSSNLNGGSNDATQGITAGAIDGFSVGTTLNANGVQYHYFVLWASTAGGNNGWGTNGEYVHVEAGSPDGGMWPDDPDEDDILATLPSTPSTTPVADPGDLTTDIASTCVAASTRLCNLALQELGITQQISNLGTEVSREAATFRLIYKTIVDQVLRDFPWPFATRYATLTLVGGTTSTPVNNDWQYSYRAPTNMIYARRITPPKNTGWKRGAFPAIPFRPGQDDSGELIFTDLAPDATNVAPSLEYTARIDCPASRGDAIFRQACIHRLAAAAAKPLERDAKDADRQMKLYLFTLNVAKTVHMNEGEHQDDQGPEAVWIAGR